MLPRCQFFGSVLLYSGPVAARLLHIPRPWGLAETSQNWVQTSAAPKEARRTERVLKKFPDYPDEKKLSGPDASAVLWAVVQRVEEETDLEEVELSGVPEWAGIYGDTAEWDGWSVGLVRECLSVIASSAGEDLEALMSGAREWARLDVISAKCEAEIVGEQLQNMRRERLLPEDKTLEKISRYEANLSRLMFKALH